MELPDVQASAPAVPVSLSRAGVTNVEKVTRIGPRLYHAKLDCFVELEADRKGVHMSRFEEVVNEVIGSVVLGSGGFRVEQIAQRIAAEVRERQEAARAEVTIAAKVAARQEIYTLLGTAVVTERGTRQIVGVASKLQRVVGTLHLGLPEAGQTDVDAAVLLTIVKGAMAGEDGVREALRRVLELFADLRDDAFVSARQETLDGVYAEAFGVLGELRRDAAQRTTRREWFSAAGSTRRREP